MLPDGAQPLGALEPAVPELIESSELDGRTTVVLALRTRAFVTGTLSFDLPPLTIDGQGSTTQLLIAPQMIEVASVLPNDLSEVTLRPLKPAERIDGAPPAPELILGPILGGLALLLLTIVVRRRLRQRRIVMPEPPPDPVAIAAAELRAIEEAGLLPARLEEFCRRVDLAVRRFLAERYALPAVNLTAAELASRLARVGVEAGTIRRVRNLCAQTDAVAYAGAIPAAARAARYVELAQAIVQPPRAASSTVAVEAATAVATPGEADASRRQEALEAPAADPEGSPATRRPPDDNSSGDRWSRPRDGSGS